MLNIKISRKKSVCGKIESRTEPRAKACVASTHAPYLVEEEGGERDRSPETPAAGAAGEAVHAEAPGELGGVVRRRGRGRHDQHPGRQAHARTSIYALPAIVQAAW